jgi:hypothetical protein
VLAVLRHRDIDAPDLALGADLHRLLVAGGPQRHAGGKSRSLDEHLDLATAGSALQIAEKIPARFAPVAGNAVTLARNVGYSSRICSCRWRNGESASDPIRCC